MSLNLVAQPVGISNKDYGNCYASSDEDHESEQIIQDEVAEVGKDDTAVNKTEMLRYAQHDSDCQSRV